MSAVVNGAGKVVGWVDDRVTTNNWLKRNLRKVFPDHWSFMLGEIALYSFIVVLLSGVFLTFWFKPSMAQVLYDGAYTPMRDIPMSEAFASTLQLTFEVRGGLLMRQVHHWSALLFVAAMCAHMLRIFFTGAFRKPREINWVIGILMLIFGTMNGFTGYSLPDDLLSGTGLRIIEGGMLAIPVVGTYLSSFIFGGEFPGEDAIARLYIIHVLLVPGILLALVTIHLMLIWYQKHTHWGGPGRSEKNVAGYPLFPVYTAKAGGFFFVVFGTSVIMGGTMQILPLWLIGPYDPSVITAGTQPDWYIGFLDGALRVMPAWEFYIAGYPISMSVLIPAVILPGLIITPLLLYPWIEQWVTGDKREHHVLDRPRNQPVRSGIGTAFITFYLLLWISGGNDYVATIFNVPVMWITRFMQIALIVLPPLVFWVTKRICLGLQRRDRDKVMHGLESGTVLVSPEGEFSEKHEALTPEAGFALTSHDRQLPIELGPETDEHGIPAPRHGRSKLRARASRAYFGDVVQKPTVEELEATHHDGHGDGHEPRTEVESADVTDEHGGELS